MSAAVSLLRSESTGLCRRVCLFACAQFRACVAVRRQRVLRSVTNESHLRSSADVPPTTIPLYPRRPRRPPSLPPSLGSVPWNRTRSRPHTRIPSISSAHHRPRIAASFGAGAVLAGMTGLSRERPKWGRMAKWDRPKWGRMAKWERPKWGRMAKWDRPKWGRMAKWDRPKWGRMAKWDRPKWG